MEDTQLACFGDLGDKRSVLRDGQRRVTTVCGIHEDAEEGLAISSVDGANHIPRFLKIRERLEFAGAEKLNVPSFDTGSFKAGLAGSPGVDLDVLGNGGLIIVASLSGSTRGHPLLNGGGRNMGHAVSFGSGEPTHKHLDHSIFVRWDHWVGAANHKNEMDIEATATETFNHFSDVAFTEPPESRGPAHK